MGLSRDAWHLIIVCLWAAVPVAATGADPAQVELFERKVRPALVRHCFACHSGATEEKATVAGGLRLDSRAGLLRGGPRGPAVMPGRPGQSLLIRAITPGAAADLRAPHEVLDIPTATIADFTAWVEGGAAWPDPTPAGPTARDAESARKHWAFQPLNKPLAPAVRGQSWVRTPVDAFVLSALEKQGVELAPPADRRTLLRRVYLDLIGLPPTPAEQRAFLADESPDALARVVDDLLARPQYGERWGRHWLDVARYAETQGYERDEPKPFAWRYRDYVIGAFNADLPYDRFVAEQLAGDEVEGADARTRIATTFLRLGTFDTIAAEAKLAKYDHYDDIVGTATAAFLGLSVRCARCHDHKFEPISHEDYHRVLALFEPLGDPAAKEVRVGSDAEHAAYEAAAKEYEQSKLAPARARLEAHRLPVVQRLLDEAKKEEATAAGEARPRRGRLRPAVLTALTKPEAERSKEERDMVTRGRQRIDEAVQRVATEAEWAEYRRLQTELSVLESAKPQPMLAYVFVEDKAKVPETRVFARGDITKPGKTVEPGVPAVLGGEGPPPPAPGAPTTGRRRWLAEWITRGPGKPLAARVMANRLWQYHFGTGLVPTPNDFGLAGDRPMHPELLEYLAAELVDGGWTLKRMHRLIVLSSTYQMSATSDPSAVPLAGWQTRRLEAEAIRDSVLAVSGALNPETGGPPIYPPVARKVVGASAGLDWGESDERQASRRSVYVFAKRSIPLPELELLGLPDSSASTDRRPVATTALQSLLLLNSRFANDQAARFAERVEREAGGDTTAQVRYAFELAFCRPPRDTELNAALAFLAAERKSESPGKGDGDLSPLASFCLVLLNSNEFVYVN